MNQLTPSIVLREALAIFVGLRGKIKTIAPEDGVTFGDLKQTYVVFDVTPSDLRLSIENLSQNKIRLAMEKLSAGISADRKFYGEFMELPQTSNFTANERLYGVAMRLVGAHNIVNDTTSLMLDVRHT